MAASKGTKDFYKVLNVKPTASRGEIKDAYRKLALALHPDRNEGCDVKADQFKSINEAYDTLADHGKRTEYDGSLNGVNGGAYNKNRRHPPPPDYRKVYSPRPPPGFKTFDERRHFDMHYGDGMAREEISDARRRYEAASERFGRSERDEGYRSPLGRGFTFDGYGKTHGGNPYSKMPQGPSAAQTFRVDYEEGHYYDLGSTNLNQARRVVSHKESVRERMNERRKNRVRNRGDPKRYEEASGCAVM